MSESVFNEGSIDVDFRVEGNGATHAFFVEGETDRVGLLTSDPTHTLVVKTDSGGSTNVLKIEEKDSTDAIVQLSFGGDYDEGSIHVYNGGTSKINLRGNGTSYIKGGDLEIESDGARFYVKSADYELVSIGRAGSSGSALDQGYFRMKSAGSNKVAFHTAGDSYINGGSLGIGTDSPDQTLHVHKGSAGSIASSSDSVLTLENSGTAILQFLTPNSNSNQIRFGDPQDNGAGYIDYNHSTSALTFGVNGPEKMRIDSSGRLGIGTTDNFASPSGSSSGSASQVTIKGSLRLDSEDDDTGSGTEIDSIQFCKAHGLGAGVARYTLAEIRSFTNGGYEGGLNFYTSESVGGGGYDISKRMILDGPGNLGIGAASPGARLYSITASTDEAAAFFLSDNNSGIAAVLVRADSSSGDRDLIKFYNGGSHVGTVSYNGTTVTYGSASDKRLKENISNYTNGLSILNQIEIKKFDWKVGKKDEVGVIAQDLNKILPNVIIEGDSDEEVETAWQVDYPRLVPYLINAIQELSTEITALKGD